MFKTNQRLLSLLTSSSKVSKEKKKKKYKNPYITLNANKKLKQNAKMSKGFLIMQNRSMTKPQMNQELIIYVWHWNICGIY